MIGGTKAHLRVGEDGNPIWRHTPISGFLQRAREYRLGSIPHFLITKIYAAQF